MFDVGIIGSPNLRHDVVVKVGISVMTQVFEEKLLNENLCTGHMFILHHDYIDHFVIFSFHFKLPNKDFLF